MTNISPLATKLKQRFNLLSLDLSIVRRHPTKLNIISTVVGRHPTKLERVPTIVRREKSEPPA